jgi:hypothetical protein
MHHGTPHAQAAGAAEPCAPRAAPDVTVPHDGDVAPLYRTRRRELLLPKMHALRHAACNRIELQWCGSSSTTPPRRAASYTRTGKADLCALREQYPHPSIFALQLPPHPPHVPTRHASPRRFDKRNKERPQHTFHAAPHPRPGLSSSLTSCLARCCLLLPLLPLILTVSSRPYPPASGSSSYSPSRSPSS